VQYRHPPLPTRSSGSVRAVRARRGAHWSRLARQRSPLAPWGARVSAAATDPEVLRAPPAAGARKT
jgi:hypothetical protein